jgi:hypothetical protein
VLGLFVVGRLARRHGIEVTLTDTPDGGVTAWVDLRPVHLVSRADSMHMAPTPIHATVGPQHGEYGSLLAGASTRSVPGSAQPFDANMLNRATRTLQSARSWNAFLPVQSRAPELEAGPSSYSAAYPATAAPHPVHPAEPVPEQPRYDPGQPIAGRHPAAMPALSPVVMEGPIVMSAPADAIQLPRQRTPDDQRLAGGPSRLRRRVPGHQLPAETGAQPTATPPSTDDALAAREAFEAFEAGVSRAQWDVIEADMASPPAAGHAPLARRVPGASLPVSGPMNPIPVASPTQPLDPDAARQLIEQFEHGVAMAMHETQHEGQPR